MSDFRVEMVTTDGSLIVYRKANKDYYYLHNGLIDKEFIESVLKQEGREKGVYFISYTVDKNTGVSAIVDWLKAK